MCVLIYEMCVLISSTILLPFGKNADWKKLSLSDTVHGNQLPQHTMSVTQQNFHFLIANFRCWA